MQQAAIQTTRLKALLSALSAGVVIATLVPGVARAADSPTPALLDAPRVPGEVVVRFDPDADAASRVAARAVVDGDRAAGLGVPGLELMEIEGTTVGDAIEDLEARSDVLYAEPNYLVTAAAMPSDPYFDEQWALHDATGDVDIDAPEAWDVTTGNRDVVVAVADTGVAWDHPDLRSNVWTNPGESGAKAANGIDDDGNGFVDDSNGWDWVDDDNDPMDLSGHGTHVAGTIAADGDNGVGIAGVAWDVKLLPLRVMGASGNGTTADVARGFSYAARAGARVVNASFGSAGYSQAVSDAVRTAPDVLFVAASGNESADNDHVPAWPCNLTHENVICVSALARNNERASFANVGATSVDLAAPGVSILSTVPSRATLFAETFDGDISEHWTTGGTAPWGSESGYSGAAFADSPWGPYANETYSWLSTRRPVDLTGAHGCALNYRLRMETFTNDALLIETSADGSLWSRAGAYVGSTHGRWNAMSEGLGAGDRALFIRFRFVSDGAMTADGAAIDDLSVRCAMKTYRGSEYSSLSGTSMATPHVTGAAAVLWGLPGASSTTVKQALLRSVDHVPSFAGTTTTGGRLNLAAAVAQLAGSPLNDAGDAVPTPAPIQTPEPATTQPPASTPTPTPTPDPETVSHDRFVKLTMVPGPRLSGRVRVRDGYLPCVADARVTVRRNGRFLRSVATDAFGSFVVRVPSYRGRYRAILTPWVHSDGHVCLGTRSSAVSS